MHLARRGRNIAELLLAEESLRGKKLSFVAHSLGGLVVKQALRIINDKMLYDRRASDFIRSVSKVCFLATPHSGSHLANVADDLRRFIRPTAAVRSLESNDANLEDLNIWYRMWATSRINHLVLLETMPVRFWLPLLDVIVVEPNSGDPGFADAAPIPVDKDHISISKMGSRGDQAYIHVRDFLQDESMYLRLNLDSRDFSKIVEAVTSGVKSQTIDNNGALKILSDKSSLPLENIVKDAKRLTLRSDESTLAQRDDIHGARSRIQQGKATTYEELENQMIRRAVASATQAIALVEMGIDRTNSAMTDRGLHELAVALDNMPTKFEQREYFRQKLVDLKEHALDVTTY